MANNHDIEKEAVSGVHHSPSTSNFGSNSSSGSGSTSSPPTTPESPIALLAEQQQQSDTLPRIHHAPHSSTPPRNGRGRGRDHRASTRLGAIDEHSNTMAPDVPPRNPNRVVKQVRFFGLPFPTWAKADADVPPPDAYDTIVGPRGEKFADVRQNKPKDLIAQGKRRRKMICFGCVAVIFFILALALGTGLGVGLTRRKVNSVSVSESAPSDSSTTDPQPFPIGTWSIPTYLTTQSTLCTSNSATWRCYPYTTYTTSPQSAFNTLLWRITSLTNSTLDLQISNTNPTFSYPFVDVPLSLDNPGDVDSSAFTFSFTYRKQVVPDGDITGDNAATRCYYNNTVVSVRLYSDSQGGGTVTGPPVGTTNSSVYWPYAIGYVETSSGGPECYRYVDGQETDAVDVPAGMGGECGCEYANYGLG